jgi:hypothetical protein
MLMASKLRNEGHIVARHPLMWIVIAAAAGFTAIAAANDSPGTTRELTESLLRLNYFVPMFILPFVAGALAPVFFLREVEHGMQDLFAAYPQGPSDWLRVRLICFTALLVGLCALLQLVIASVLSLNMSGPLWPTITQSVSLFAIIHLPACLIWVCALVWTSCIAGKSGFVYVAAGFGWLAYVGLATLTGTPLIAGSIVAWEPLRQAMLFADPYAIAALVDAGRVSGLAQPGIGVIALGRAGWLLFCFWLVRSISARPSDHWRQTTHQKASNSSPSEERRLHLPDRAGTLAMQLRWILADKVVLISMAGWIVLILPEIYSGMGYAEQLSMVSPDSRDALNRIMWDTLPVMAMLLLLFAADRLCRMDRALGINELTAATPCRSWRFLAWQLLSIWLLVLLMLMLTLIVVLLAQITAQSTIQTEEYLVQAVQAVPGLVLTGTFYVAIHGVVRSRMAANLINFALFVFGFNGLAPSIGLHHPLWKPFSIPLAEPDHIFGPSGNWPALFAFSLFWALLGAAAVCIAVVVWHRNTPFKQLSAWRAAHHPALYGAALLLAGTAWQGAAINGALEADGALATPQEQMRWRADYERNYSHWADKFQPEVAEVHSFVAFDPQHGAVNLQVAMHLINRNPEPIKDILVGRNQIETNGTISIEGASMLSLDKRLNQRIFRLKHPIAPGEMRVVHFATRVKLSGLLPAEGFMALRKEFASLPAFQILPVIGFKRELTLRDPEQRSRAGLAPLRLKQPSQLPEDHIHPMSGSQAILDTVVQTMGDYQGVAQGELVQKWQENGRNYFHFRTENPIRNLPIFFALNAQSVQWRVGNTAAEILAPELIGPTNSNRLAVSDTIAWLDHAVAPFPGRTLRLIAVPELGFSGYALPQTVMISHRLGFLARPGSDAGFSQVYRRAVHETAHQWFGHLLGYGIEEEHAFLVESLAKYAELVMIERRYGRSAMRALVDFERARYSRARLAPSDATVPLIDAEDNEDMYSRATITFACLREKVGDDAILAALRELARVSRKSGNASSSLNFVGMLKAGARREMATTIDELLLGTSVIDKALRKVGCVE